MHVTRILLAVLTFSPAPATAECLHYDLSDVTLQGQVIRGAPSKASTTKGSSPQDSWYFVTSQPICIAGDKDNQSVAATHRFKIWPSGRETFDSYAGRTAQISGHFFPTYIPHFHSYLIFEVTSIQALSDGT